MSSNPARGQAPGASGNVRPLPPRPSLEYERKQAKRLLARARRGDRDAVARVGAHLGDRGSASPGALRLADAQFAIAREYGFRSWPRMVEYLTTLERHERSRSRTGSASREHHEASARSIVADHRRRVEMVGRLIGTFVPRFYGATLDEIFAAELTEDEARLVVARMDLAPSWEALLERSGSEPADDWEMFTSPAGRASRAIRDGDLATLQRIVAEHPDVLDARVPGEPDRRRLMNAALGAELKTRSAEARRITAWLASQGLDPSTELNRMLLMGLRPRLEEYRALLEHGADPNWLPPNGITILEHALIRSWSPEVVDLIAQRVVPPKAFWIAAGLGDVRSVRRYFDRHGRLTEAARRRRPDFTAAGIPAPMLPDADDTEIMWEAFFVAGVNRRFAVLDLLLDRGFPIDYMSWGATLLHFAVGNGMADLVEYLVRRGANLEVKGRQPHANAREMAETYFLASRPRSAERVRILELVGARDAETLLREQDARRSGPAALAPVMQRVLEVAREEAVRRGREAVSSDDLFVACLRDRPGFLLHLLARAGADLERLQSMLADRLSPPPLHQPAGEVPFDAQASAVLQRAREEAERRRSAMVYTTHLVYALAEQESGWIADALRSVGSTPAKLREAVESVLE